ncbi:FHA domain protein, partial [Cooperia oncophora]
SACDVAFPNSCLLPIHVTIHRNLRRNRIGYSISSVSSGQVSVNDEVLLCGRKRDLAFHDVITLLEAGIVDDMRPYLAWESNSYIHCRYLEEKKSFSIGSDRMCDVSLPTPHLAAHHATIVRNICRGTIQFSVKPAFSRRAYVFVNDIPVSKRGTKILTNGDILTVSKDPRSVKFRFNSGDGSKARTSTAATAKSTPVQNLSKASQTPPTTSNPEANAVPTAVQERQQLLSTEGVGEAVEWNRVNNYE